MTEFEEGYLLGILVGEGHFSGDGYQAQVTVRMHVRQVELLHRLALLVPDSRLYGPYHSCGRNFCQWMVRGQPLREELVPFLRRYLDYVDSHIRDRIVRMLRRYEIDD